ncbi:MAG: hypothetical protein WD313_05760 [Acidimicrobiia bacterium]
MIDDANKGQAAAQRLAEAAGLDVAVDPNISHQSQVRLTDASNVIARARELVASGEFDGFIGAVGHCDDDWYVSLLLRRMDLHAYEQGQACARALLDRLRNYVASHPFEDDAGHPFA